MHVTVRNYAGSSEMVDVLVENGDAVRRLISEIDGFRAYYLVRTDDGALSISVFDDAAGGEESSRSAAKWVGENASDVQSSPPQISAGEAVLAFWRDAREPTEGRASVPLLERHLSPRMRTSS